MEPPAAQIGDEPDEPQTPQIFRNTQNLAQTFALAYVGFFIGAMICIGVFFIMLLIPSSGPFQTVPVILVVLPTTFAGAAVFQTASRPWRITLESDGILIEWMASRRRFAWNQIAEVRRAKAETTVFDLKLIAERINQKREVLVLCNERGKKIVEVPDSFGDFSTLASRIEALSSDARQQPTVKPDAEAARRLKKQKRSRALLFGMGIFLGFMGVVTLRMSYCEYQEEREYRTGAKTAQAKITKHEMFNITPRLEYEFADENGDIFTGNVAMMKPEWERLSGVATVEVVYLPSNPSSNRPARGMRKNDSLPPLLAIPTSIVMILGALFLIVLAMLGIADVKMDGNRIRIVRVGDTGESAPAPGSPPPPPPIPTRRPLAPPPPAFAGAQPEATAPPPDSPAERVPPGIRVLGGFAVAFGAFAIVFGLIRIAILTVMLSMANPDDGTIEMGVWVFDPGESGYLYAEHGSKAVIGLALFVGGIGLLRLREWSRRLVIGASAAQLLLSALLIVEVVRMSADTGEFEETAKFAWMLSRHGAIGLTLIFMTIPLMLFYVLIRRSTREYFLE